MKKLSIFILMIISLCAPALAIDWLELTTPLGKHVMLDLDSIVQKDGYYFYNIQNASSTNVLTIQSNVNSPFSAKINTQSQEEYAKLNGNYENIAQNATDKLEAVTFQSVVYTCYKKVKQQMRNKNSIQIVQ